jgi:cyanophycin synthetase
VSFLWDDDEVSVGLGTGSQSWPFRELPDPAELDWSAFHDVPAGIVTGTNGKTTTVRIAKHILQTAGKDVGLSCTDWVAVNDRIIDRDDWSGPGGARMVLRQQDVNVAILETARGGLLRRGLGVNTADVALITNIAEDHLGDFGSQNLQELLNIKWVISHAVATSGVLILNADDRLLVGKAATFNGRIVWFSLDENNPVVTGHIARGGLAYVYGGGDLIRVDSANRETICAAGDVPITLDGAAAHNIANALGAAALTEQLGMSLAEIRNGLTSMSQDANPGRSNIFPVRGFKVLVDFAHNPEAMQALFAMARAIPARRRVLCFAQAGDRTDEQIRELARSAWSIGLELACIAELEAYRRGREEGEVFNMMRDELIQCGAKQDQIRYFATESESFDAALQWAEDGDLVVILDLGRNSGVQEKLEAWSQAGSDR